MTLDKIGERNIGFLIMIFECASFTCTFRLFLRTFQEQRLIRCNGHFVFSIYTNIVVFSDVYNGEQLKAAALPVSARELLFPGNVFKSHIPGL